MLDNKLVAKWMTPIAIDLSFGCVHLMIIRTPWTSPVEWINTHNAKIMRKIMSLVSHLPLSQNPIDAFGSSTVSVNKWKLKYRRSVDRPINTYQQYMSIPRSFSFHSPQTQIYSRHGRRRSKCSHRCRRSAQTSRCRKDRLCWRQCKEEWSSLSCKKEQNYFHTNIRAKSWSHPSRFG